MDFVSDHMRSTGIEKISGCNHMSCSVCRTALCWLWGQKRNAQGYCAAHGKLFLAVLLLKATPVKAVRGITKPAP